MTDTKSKILDAAERLFALDGIDGTSLRDITRDAGVNLAAVNYHFQSRESLISAVIARRILPVNERRIQMLDAYEANGPATPEQIAEAFLLPVLEAGAEHQNMRPMMGRMLAAPNEFLHRIFKTHLAAIGQRFLESLSRSLPDLPKQDLVWRLHFMVGVMAHVIAWSGVLSTITDGMCDVKDTNALTRRMVAFVAAGLKAPATNHEG
ncbi:MAG: TetR family transcriptional regulator [Bryobacteraceae bacterium]